MRASWLLVLAGALLLAVPAWGAYIGISAIGDKGVGEKFTITASTDLPAGTQVLVTVYSSSFSPTQKIQSGEFSGAKGTTVVMAGGGNPNSISFDVDAATFKPDEYMVTMEAITQGTTGNARFNVVEKVLVGYFITINTIGDRYVGDRVTITARTNLPQGEDVVLTVTSPSFSLTRSGKVTTGGGGVNRVSYDLDTSALEPDTYSVSARAAGGTISPKLSFRLLGVETSTPTPITPTPMKREVFDWGGLLLAGAVVAGLAGAMVVGTKVLGGRAAAQAARPAVRSDVRLEVRRGMEVEEMDLGKAGIRLDVEAGIGTPDETLEGGSG